jgi:hypothetical protein
VPRVLVKVKLIDGRFKLSLFDEHDAMIRIICRPVPLTRSVMDLDEPPLSIIETGAETFRRQLGGTGRWSAKTSVFSVLSFDVPARSSVPLSTSTTPGCPF